MKFGIWYSSTEINGHMNMLLPLSSKPSRRFVLGWGFFSVCSWVTS